jgi:membrane protein implicated in regulation of membrane protease activity
VNNPILIVACISVTVGIVCGALVVWFIYLHRQYTEVDSLVRSNHVIGRVGIVEIPFDSNSQGKIRVNVKGSLVDFLALTDEAQEFSKGSRVLVVAMKGNKVWVASESVFDR